MKRETAKKIIEERIEFYSHFVTYLIVNVVLLVINFLTNPDYFWVIWPITFWGFGVLIHFLSVFVFKYNVKGAKEKWIKDLMKKNE